MVALQFVLMWILQEKEMLSILLQNTLFLQFGITKIEQKMGWFALSDLERIIICEGEFTSVNGKDLIENMNRNAYMVYVEL